MLYCSDAKLSDVPTTCDRIVGCQLSNFVVFSDATISDEPV